MVNAVILAGRPNQGTLQEEDAPYEALIDIAGKPMIQWVIEALQTAKQIDRTAVVAPAGVRGVVEALGAIFVEAGDSLTENVRRGARALPRDEAILIAAGDIPLLRPDMVDDFLQRADESRADIVYPIIEKSVCEANYPLVRRTYVGLKEGTFTGGNFVFLQPGSLAPALRLLQDVFAARKKPWRLAAMLGWKFVIQLLTRSARLQELEDRATALLGVQAKALVMPYPEIGIDVDKPEDLKLVRSALR